MNGSTPARLDREIDKRARFTFTQDEVTGCHLRIDIRWNPQSDVTAVNDAPVSRPGEARDLTVERLFEQTQVTILRWLTKVGYFDGRVRVGPTKHGDRRSGGHRTARARRVRKQRLARG